MPIPTPINALQQTSVSRETPKKSLPIDRAPFGTDMSNSGTPPRATSYGSDISPSKLVMPVTPNEEESSTAHSEDFSEDSSAVKIVKTDHKLFEESDDFEEPLLKENPHRFVLFPIQDNDVS